jgi:sRNA-binding protein
MFKRTTMVALLVGLAGFAYATSAIAANDQVRLVGKLAKMDGKTLTIVSTADKASKPTLVTYTDATKYRRDADNTTVKIADLKVGQTVRVYYTKADKIATLVNIAKPGSK